ncbi:MAG TPA: type II toxin-antitoxin system HicA family toxin [Candidatus Levilactobacillus faecigallinarum]|uniref:Type II toxin-antitoxin system HicA family toxin n=1 Tax=Candidatus Levilactobacillus faecigallinarum TaxID=2838638 RepID=A0A9D1U484_9LACO|nr:type II toxin-antitoxin system HicA family toxin [Candidatus Levilactobacillus faecigallinarum]
MPMTPRKMIRLLRKAGFIEKPGQHNGTSHVKYWNPITNRTVPVPIHAKELKTGTEQGILKQAGLKK